MPIVSILIKIETTFRGTNEVSGDVMVNGEVSKQSSSTSSSSSTPVVSITNPSMVDTTSPSNSSSSSSVSGAGKQVSVVS